MHDVGWTPVALALAAIGYTLQATIAVRRFDRAPRSAAARAEPVTLLKPLHGVEPRLAENLRSFLAQDWPASVQVIAGTERADDPALAVARLLGVEVRTDAPMIGANAKIANLANLMPAARHDLLVLSDSDMAVPLDYLARIAATLARPGVGAVTCLYYGRGDAGVWSRFAAAAIGWQFAPSVLMSLALRLEHPCMGSTIALRQETLARIGGFAAFANQLADDYAIGAAVRGMGLRVVVAPGLWIVHDSTEASGRAVWRHELRWASTLRAVNPWGHAGSVLTHPVPLALLATAFHPLAGVVALGVALGARLLLAVTVHGAAGERAAPLSWLPARDLFSFAVFVASFFARSVDWRGARLSMKADGRIAADS